MTITDSSWRGCASKFQQPLTSKDIQEAQSLHDKIYHVNCKEEELHNIIYRTGEGEKDTLRHVFRWDLTPYEHVFQHGFEVCHKTRVHDKTFYNLVSYVQGIRPLDSRKTSRFGFISTTISNSWYPHIPCSDEGVPKTVEVYRYEIYAPGGIWTSLTLGDKNCTKAKRLDEVAFVGGIAPQYIRSAQLFKLSGNQDGTTTIERLDNIIQINGNFNPQSHPFRLLNIENPVSDYSEDKTPLTQNIIYQSSSTSTHSKIIDWYANDVANRDIYLTAALRSSQLNEAYYILQNLCTQLYYDPGGTHDHIVKGPIPLSKMFKSLQYTPFGEHGIDASFQLEGDEAIIFSGNLCALINYAPNTENNEILKGPMTIVEMFPFFEGTVFENGIDEACELKSVDHEAYIFKQNICAHISYGYVPQLIALGQISQFFPLLKGTIFDSFGVDAAYASHADNEVAYFFKFNTYGQINVNLDDGVEYLLGVWVMGANAAVIHSFVPQKNRGLDMRTNPGALPNPEDYSHDEI